MTTFEYDNRNRKITENAPLGRTTRWEYDANGNVTRVVNPDGTDNRKTYDALNRVLTSTDEMGQVTSYTYWPSGQVHTITDPRGFTYEHLYDASIRLTERKYPTPSGVGYGSSERWDFNADGTLAANPIDETYVDVVEQFTFRPSLTGYTFPVGRYLPVKRENGGVFYESPIGIKVRTLGGSYVVKGGIFRGDPNARNESSVSVYAHLAGGLQMVPMHSMIGLDLNKKMRCAPPLNF